MAVLLAARTAACDFQSLNAGPSRCDLREQLTLIFDIGIIQQQRHFLVSRSMKTPEPIQLGNGTFFSSFLGS